jgi:hypothetical protein
MSHGPAFGYEKRDASMRSAARFMIGLSIVVLLGGAVCWLVLRVFEHVARQHYAHVPPRERILPPEPRLEASPLADLEAVHQEEDALLNTYGWVDRTHGTARIPIDRAIELLARRGLPARSEK